MSSIEPHAPRDPVVENTGSIHVASGRRRRLAGLGIGAPILMTLASRQAVAGQCLSNMLSGNLSNPDRGNCVKGWSPGGWGLAGGQIYIYSTPGAWAAIGLYFGDAVGCNNGGGNCNYAWGTASKLSDVPAGLNRNGLDTSTALPLVLTQNPDQHQLTRHLLCAYLNAKLSGLPGSGFHYILTTQQVLDLAAGTLAPPPPFSNTPQGLQDFLGSTWN